MKKKKRSFGQSLFFQTYLYLGIMLVILGGLIGIIYSNLYRRTTMDSYYNVLDGQARNISERVTRYLKDEDIENYALYLNMLQDTMNADLWIISNENATNPMSEDFVNVDISQIDLREKEQNVINKAFLGESESITGYNPIYDMMTMTLGYPIFDQNDDIAGALLLITPIESQNQQMGTTIVYFLLSLGGSLIISFIIAILFARRLSTPISKITQTALKMAEGEYSIRTNLSQKDEIGQLANSIDKLAYCLEEAKQEQENNNQMRQDFFANVSHELRTPITVVRAYVEMLVDGVETDQEKVEQSYIRMLNECSGMERLIGDLLLIAKMENPDFEFEMEPVDVVQIIDDVVRSARMICSNKNIEIQFDKETVLCMMLGDYDRLKQMFIAVVENAIKFSGKNSTVYIKIRVMDTIIVSIEDQGIGMDENEMSQIFDKFYTKKMSINKDGTGLGLMIAKQIATKHKGTIQCKSKKGIGTRFTFEFEALDLKQFKKI